MEIFKLFGSVLIKTDEAQKSISKTSEQAKGLGSKLGSGIKTAAKWGAAIGAAAVAVGVAMYKAASAVAKQTDEIDKASQRAGMSAEQYQKLNYAMQQCGVSASTFEGSAKKLNTQISNAMQGSEKANAAFESLGVSLTDAAGNMRESGDIYNDTLAALADIGDATERNAIAADLFGRSYSDLAPILNQGSEGIAELTNRAQELGLVMSQDTIDAGVKFGDTLQDVKDAFGMLGSQVAAEFLPLLQSFLDWILTNLPAIQDGVSVVIGYVKTAISGIIDFFREHGDQIISIIKGVFEFIKPLVKGALEAIQAIINAVFALIDGDIDGFLNGIVNAIKAIGSALFNAGKEIFNKLWDGFKSIWSSIADWFSSKINWIKDKLTVWKDAKLEMDAGSPDGSHAAGLNYVPYDGYKAILHKGETVLSAGKTKNMVEEIVNGLAPFMGSGGGDYTINLVVDGKTLAQTVFNPLRDIVQQGGVPIG